MGRVSQNRRGPILDGSLSCAEVQQVSENGRCLWGSGEQDCGDRLRISYFAPHEANLAAPPATLHASDMGLTLRRKRPSLSECLRERWGSRAS